MLLDIFESLIWFFSWSDDSERRLHSSSRRALRTLSGEGGVVLVSAPFARDPLLNEQRRRIAEAKDGERELKAAMIELVGQETLVNGIESSEVGCEFLRREFNLGGENFAVVVIGTDAKPLSRRHRPLTVREMREMFGTTRPSFEPKRY